MAVRPVDPAAAPAEFACLRRVFLWLALCRLGRVAAAGGRLLRLSPAERLLSGSSLFGHDSARNGPRAFIPGDDTDRQFVLGDDPACPAFAAAGFTALAHDVAVCRQRRRTMADLPARKSVRPGA